MTDEQFFAWLDGELPPVEADRVAAEVTADPALQARAAEHRTMQAGLAAAFAPILTQPVPELIRVAATPRAEVIDFAAARAKRAARARSQWRQWGALAATLCVGFSIGLLSRGGDDGLVRQQGKQMIAGTALSDALNTRLASFPEASGMRIGLTFRNQQGLICRSFAGDAATGLACRDQGSKWMIKGLFGPRAPSGDYRMAAGDDPALAALIDDTIAGEPLDAAGERAARAEGWK